MQRVFLAAAGRHSQSNYTILARGARLPRTERGSGPMLMPALALVIVIALFLLFVLVLGLVLLLEILFSLG